MKRLVQLLFLGVFLFIFMVMSVSPVSATKQKYNRVYQKKTTYVQKKDPYFQEQDLPNAGAYLQVNRKKPELVVRYSPQDTVYNTQKQNITCRSKESPSCTYFSVSFKVLTDCDTSKITLEVSETRPMTIEISSLYKKGTCFFDQILKHELTHENVYRQLLSLYLQKTAQNLILEYEKGQEKSKGCKDIQNQLISITDDMQKQYAAEAQKENARLDDAQGNHLYDMDACLNEDNR